MPRRGFTLIELLVACGVFLFGFTATFAMFLAGTRARSQADGIIRLSLAASSLAEEFKLEAGREDLSVATAAVPFAPSAYIGDGFAAVNSVANETGLAASAPLFRYRSQPGVWYRVVSCRDEKGSTTDRFATALQMELLVVWNPAPDDSLTLGDLALRQRPKFVPTPDDAGTTDRDEYAESLTAFLAQRGFAVREQIVFIRRPSWER
jgi:prepilin-type N-terminal cleavage/methylation domain-containing protein